MHYDKQKSGHHTIQGKQQSQSIYYKSCLLNNQYKCLGSPTWNIVSIIVTYVQIECFLIWSQMVLTAVMTYVEVTLLIMLEPI